MALFVLPAVLAFEERWRESSIRQVLEPSSCLTATSQPDSDKPGHWSILTPQESAVAPILILKSGTSLPDDFTTVLKAKSALLEQEGEGYVDLSGATWLRHPQLANIPEPPIDYDSRIALTIRTWDDSFTYRVENADKGIRGLRPPQLGAIHAIQAHWSISDEPATIVMPTGTGKTETMLSVLVLARCPRLLVVVPTDALRAQLVSKFLSFGVLKQTEVVNAQALYPIVGTLKTRPQNPIEIDDFFGRCQVIVTTMQIAGQCSEDVQRRMADLCPYLFVDEAHHIAAHTWKGFKRQFQASRILQFTATPFRNDDKPIDGKIIFNYPLRLAQQQGYFRPIRFDPVREYRRKRADVAIAEKAVAQLRLDSQKYNHILMARADDTRRAQDIFAIYEKYKEFNPVQLHTGIKSKPERDRIRRQIVEGKAKIVVCVDMLGEGFDLPELKIAAFHDIHKSLAITLQLAGRFTRARSDLGDPTFIANVADVDVRDELKRLYSRDTDWNLLLPQLSEQAIKEETNLQEFMRGFANPPKDISLSNLQPAVSTVIYRTASDYWTPENFMKGVEGAESLELIRSAINHQANTLIIITARRVPIDWGQIQEVFNWDWELYVLFWDPAQKLLFINSSNNNGYYRKLAEAVAGDVELIKGQPVFRCFSGINRLKLQNVGLIRQLGKLIRYSMQAGSDVEPGLTEILKRNTRKGNIFGMGYENGERTSIGCSYRGRIWSRRTTNVEALTRWCSFVGSKVIDEAIDPDEVLKGTLVPETVARRPEVMPVSVEWPEIIYSETETAFQFVIDGQVIELSEAELRLKEPSKTGELVFELYSDIVQAEFVLELGLKEDGSDYSFNVKGEHFVAIERGPRQVLLTDFFYDHSPVIWFADGSALEGNQYTQLHKKADPYPKEKIEEWSWVGVDIRKESQGVGKTTDSIQHRVIETLKRGDYDVIFDDDSSGEAADVVAVRDTRDNIEIEFYHCKYSSTEVAGARIEDLYVVCGQAQKSTHWKRDLDRLFDHLQRREPKREGSIEATRFEKGDPDLLSELASKCRTCRPDLTVIIVQPGLSKEKVSLDQLQLLAVTQTYLFETYQLGFKVIASA